MMQRSNLRNRFAYFLDKFVSAYFLGQLLTTLASTGSREFHTKRRSHRGHAPVVQKPARAACKANGLTSEAARLRKR